MSDANIYIKVILPLRLEWEPLYKVPEGIHISVGDRVRVRFAREEYIGVASEVCAVPDIDITKISTILRKEEFMEKVSEGEIRLWRFIADYYLCTVGEVCKAAYPVAKVNEEGVDARAAERREAAFGKKTAALEAAVERVRIRLEKKLQKQDELKTDAAKERLQPEIDIIREQFAQAEAKLKEAVAAGPQKAEMPAADDCWKNAAIELSPAQEEAYGRIKTAFASKKAALLHGITGSGKTEIYTKLALDAFSASRSVLYLVPEIALSRQLEDRLRAVFGSNLLAFHSGISASGKRKVAAEIRRRAAEKAPYIVLGTRSAIFLPHSGLGLVVVDEEHDSSYKQDAPAPRYSGRECAIVLASFQGAGAVLGSATPSLESLYNCSAGRYVKVDLTERFYSAGDAEVEIIDTIAERKKNGMVGSFSRKLIARIQDSLSSGGQVILLRARRAYSPLVQCPGCGDVPHCPRCNVSMSLHKTSSGAMLECHYCGQKEAYSGKCAKCGTALVPMGSGTQKIEEEAAALFPSARIARLDSDSAKVAGYETETIRSFSEGRTDILIGTQIVTKGFDFSGLELVAVLQADGMLGQQDFRADERALQMLEQFRGRCGRRGGSGSFVVQTAQPEHPVYKSLMPGSGTADSMMLAERKLFGYPPFSRLVNIIVKDTDARRADEMSLDLTLALRGRLGGSCQVIGPYAPAVDMVAGKAIRHIRIMLPKDRNLSANKQSAAACVRSFEEGRKWKGHCALDVDPA